MAALLARPLSNTGLPMMAIAAHLLKPTLLHCIGQDKRDLARLSATVGPGMIGAVLDNGIAGFQQIHFIVHHHVDFAGQDHRIVERVRAMHERMPGILDNIITSTHLSEGRLAIQLCQFFRVLRIELDDAKDRTMLRWLELQRPVNWIVMALHSCRRLIVLPKIGERGGFRREAQRDQANLI